eukprot:CAMPEP_0204618854 /NCGR_PEP_ID=MMETSP0717-20131115/5385_1 /ASSEMBLY_ACC=CAM_ASM_000666 /TAXON_ID=230516 /ORGANISM="Chaetoceros curvisetus" /LENGTH=38 /DNA_ID= /DNA_START= /DNA_END= /DNA_ORIENTATION=
MPSAAKDPKSVNATSNPGAPANNPEPLVDTIDAFHKKH